MACRHSVAEGLRRYSQTTWEMTMGTTGRDQVAHFLPEVTTGPLSPSRPPSPLHLPLL